jgi:hypothetical protein
VNSLHAHDVTAGAQLINSFLDISSPREMFFVTFTI